MHKINLGSISLIQLFFVAGFVLSIHCIGLSSLSHQQQNQTFENVASAIATISADCPGFRIAIVNGVKYHFEVLAGLLFNLESFAKFLDVYIPANIEHYDGAWELLKDSNASFFDVKKEVRRTAYNFVIFVSIDYEFKACLEFAKKTNPNIILSIVHNADHPLIPKIVSMHPKSILLTLAPHVSKTLSKRIGKKVDWMLAVKIWMPLRESDNCTNEPTQQGLDPCYEGFALQGKFSNLRRNYSSIWEQLKKYDEKFKDPQFSKLFKLHLLGKGSIHRLHLRSSLVPFVRVHHNLPYSQFFGIISRNIALIPSLASPKYLTHKFSNTIMVSLLTGTPIIADETILRAYNFLDDAVFLQRAGVGEVETMMALLTRPQEVVRVRQRLQEIRETLNQQALLQMGNLILHSCFLQKGTKS